jgi:hypothetical protein
LRGAFQNFGTGGAIETQGGGVNRLVFSGHEPVPIPPGQATAAYRREISLRQFDRLILREQAAY